MKEKYTVGKMYLQIVTVINNFRIKEMGPKIVQAYDRAF